MNKKVLWKKCVAAGLSAAVFLSSAYVPTVFAEESQTAKEVTELPSKYDLRELGVVTPVKMQNPFGTCWGFAVTAAAETSILSETGQKYDKETNDFDLSELHLAWFALHPLPENSETGQGGEGIYSLDPTDPTGGMNGGGHLFYGTAAYASGIGPRSEASFSI